MSTKTRVDRHRIYNLTETTIWDKDNPHENINGHVAKSEVKWNDTENITGADKPGWRNIIANKGDALNAVTSSRARFTVTSQSGASLLVKRKRNEGSPPLKIVYRSESVKWRTRISFTKPSPGTHLPDAISIATRSFVSKGRSALSPGNLGVTMGELNESIRMVANPGRAIVDSIRSYLVESKKRRKRYKYELPRKQRQIAAETWLEFSFGWQPLIADTKSLAEAAAATASGLAVTHINAFGRAETQQASSSGSQAFPGCGTIEYDVLNKTSTSCSLYGAIKHEFTQPGGFPDKFGLQMNNWLPSAWELVPWSFAIDYFTGVGDFISSLCFPTSSFQYIGRSTRTIVQRKSANYRIVGDTKQESTNLSIQTSFSPGQTVAEVDSFNRVPIYNLISPVSFRLPAAKKVYANLASLLLIKAQQYDKRRL